MSTHEGRTSTKAFLRFLPDRDASWEHVKISEDKREVYVRSLQDLEKGNEGLVPSYWRFQTDGVFYNNSQKDIYATVFTADIFDRILEGNNAIILAYGQTCSGKTVTTTGLQSNYEDRGIVPRLVEDLYRMKEDRKNKYKICLHISYVEMNRHLIRDLLSTNETLYDMNTMSNVSKIRVKNSSDTLKIIFKSESRKTFRVRDHYLSNMASSVLSFVVHSKRLATSDSSVGKLHIVDLSGADTDGNFPCLHKSSLEVGDGNLAKTQLEQITLMLSENNAQYAALKQRLSVIIYYLREALNSNSVLRFVGHVRPSNEDIKITISMLRFAQLVRGLPLMKLNPHFFKDQEAQIKFLEDELAVLKKEKDLNSMLNNQDLSANLSQERYEHVQRLADDYLHDKLGEIVILNTTDAVLAMKVFKNLCNKIEAERNGLMGQIKVQEDVGSTARQKESSTSSRTTKKHSNNSTVSLIKSKKSTTKKRGSKESRKDIGSILESHEPSAPSLRTSRHSSKMLKKKSSKRRSCDSSIVIKSQGSTGAVLPAKVPENIPTHEEAWEMFTLDADCQYEYMKEEYDRLELNISEIFAVYNEEVRVLREAMEVLEIRLDEIKKANLLRDLQQVRNVDGVIILTDLEKKCSENLKKAENDLTEQKEKVLKTQAEMKVYMGCKQAIRTDIEKKYEEYCKSRFNVIVPDLFDEKMIAVQLPSANSCELTSELLDNVATVAKPTEDQEKCKNFEDLRKYMRHEYEKRLKHMKRNKKWVQSSKMPVR